MPSDDMTDGVLSQTSYWTGIAFLSSENYSHRLVTLPTRPHQINSLCSNAQFHPPHCLQTEFIIVHNPQAAPSLTIHLHRNELILDPFTSYSLVLQRCLPVSQAPLLASRPCRCPIRVQACFCTLAFPRAILAFLAQVTSFRTWRL